MEKDIKEAQYEWKKFFESQKPGPREQKPELADIYRKSMQRIFLATPLNNEIKDIITKDKLLSTWNIRDPVKLAHSQDKNKDVTKKQVDTLNF